MWPGRGPWVIAATSVDVDWRAAVAGLGAVAEVPVAVVALGASVPAVDSMRPQLSGLLEIGAVDQLELDRARDLIGALARTYDLVLVAGEAGLLVPLGRNGWTLADLAVALTAPVVVVTGPGGDSVNHTSLALDALTGRDIAAAVVTVGDVDLPFTVAGRIPAPGAAEAPEGDEPVGEVSAGVEPAGVTAVAAGDGSADDNAGSDEATVWFDPMLRAVREPPTPPQTMAVPVGRPVDGRRFVLSLIGVFSIMVLLACGLGWCSTGPTTAELQQVSPPATATVSRLVPRPVAPPPTRTSVSTDLCPEYAGSVTATRPGAATTARVGRAWKRIEKWLAAHAPLSARSLRPPADAKAVDDLQRRMSVPFPPDLVASLRRHEGAHEQGFELPFLYVPQTLDGIYRDWQVRCGIFAGEENVPGDPWWHPDFVPFAAAGDGGSLLVDQRPGGHGRVGEFYPEDGTDFAGWPASVAELLELTATSLETGRPFAGRYRPLVTAEGDLDWDVVRTSPAPAYRPSSCCADRPSDMAHAALHGTLSSISLRRLLSG